jgi:chemotaxis protein MotA
MVPIALTAVLLVGAELWPEFLNLPSLLLTLGGSVAVIFFSYSKRQLRDLAAAVRAVFTEPRRHVDDHVNELSRLTGLYRADGLRGLESQEHRLQDPFLKHGVAMLVDLQKAETIHATLGRESASVLAQYQISRQILLTLAKLLPAFGLIGTLTGMVLLLKDISGPDAPSLPSALSLAVLTTLYGAVLANVAVAPLAARLHAVAVEKETRMQLTLEWVTMILRRESSMAAAAKPRPRTIPAAAAVNRPRKRTAATSTAQA